MESRMEGGGTQDVQGRSCGVRCCSRLCMLKPRTHHHHHHHCKPRAHPSCWHPAGAPHSAGWCRRTQCRLGAGPGSAGPGCVGCGSRGCGSTSVWPGSRRVGMRRQACIEVAGRAWLAVPRVRSTAGRKGSRAPPSRGWHPKGTARTAGRRWRAGCPCLQAPAAAEVFKEAGGPQGVQVRCTLRDQCRRRAACTLAGPQPASNCELAVVSSWRRSTRPCSGGRSWSSLRGKEGSAVTAFCNTWHFLCSSKAIIAAIWPAVMRLL